MNIFEIVIALHITLVIIGGLIGDLPDLKD
jgi:hypothetical protein